MSNGVNTFPVNVSCNSGSTSANPPKLPVKRAQGTAITINWNAQGGSTFPESGFFSWKNSTNPGILPTRSSDGTTLTLNYNIPGSVNWAYNITLSGCATQDPEIDNEVPPGEEEVIPPKNPPGQQGPGGPTGGGNVGGGQPGGGQTGGSQNDPAKSD